MWLNGECNPLGNEFSQTARVRFRHSLLAQHDAQNQGQPYRHAESWRICGEYDYQGQSNPPAPMRRRHGERQWKGQ